MYDVSVPTLGDHDVCVFSVDTCVCIYVGFVRFSFVSFGICLSLCENPVWFGCVVYFDMCMYGWVLEHFGLFLYCVYLTRWLQPCLGPRLGAPESRNARRGEVRLGESAHPFLRGALREGCWASRRSCPC